MATSIVLMSACPIYLFDPIHIYIYNYIYIYIYILLYLLPKLKRYSCRKPPRPVYVKALMMSVGSCPSHQNICSIQSNALNMRTHIYCTEPYL